ncbi:MAG: IS66 family transposase [Pedobacter sp.]
MGDLPVISREILEGLSKDRLIDIILFKSEQIARLKEQIEVLETKLNANSSNSNQPPSSDSPYTKPAKKVSDKKGKPGAKKGHKGIRQQMLEPTDTKPLHPERCSCGNSEFMEVKPYYTHQHIELPEIRMLVTHFVLYRGDCTCCGKTNRALIPSEFRSGYGPRLSAVIAELAGSHGDSRTIIQNFCASVLGFSISLGAIQKVLDRASEAIMPHYEAIGEKARQQAVNHVDETSWRLKAALCWLWVLTSTTVAFFMIHTNRSKDAFKALIKDWEGILVSDGYRLYTNWVGLRQTCLAHLIREAKKLSESKNQEIAKFGANALAELRRLCHMAHAPPTIGEWRAFYARFIKLITRHHGQKDDAGKFAARLLREIDSLWLFLEKAGVSPTNNHAERMLRFAVCWRKRSYGNVSDKGHRWVERILSVRQTCRLQTKRTFPILVEALDCYFKGTKPDVAWIAQA